MMIHLGIERAFGQRFLQRIQQAALLKRRSGITASQKLIQQISWNHRLLAPGNSGTPSRPLCPPYMEILTVLPLSIHSSVSCKV